MNRKTPWTASLALAAAMVVGCESKQEETVTPAAPTAAEQKAADTVNKVTTPVTGAGAAATDAAKDAGAAVKDAGAAAKDAAAGTAGEVKDALGGTADAAVKQQADGLIAQVRTYLSEKKLDDAAKVVEQLRGLRDKLPADYQAKVDEVIKLYDAAKGAAGAIPGGLPGVGGGAK